MQNIESKIRFGIHSGQLFNSFEDCLTLWQKAEALGFDWGSIFDHFRPPDFPKGPCFEGSTFLSALAARTTSLRCGMLVFGIPNRHPALVANIATTIDHVSNGRFELGLGAGALDLAQGQYGFPFPEIKMRMEMLDEYCIVLNKLLYQEEANFEGKYYQLEKAGLAPKPIQNRIPILIGGAGEKFTLYMVAKHADIWNSYSTGDVAMYQHKLAVLERHCNAVNRKSTAIRKSLLFRIALFTDHSSKQACLDKFYNGQTAEQLMNRGFLFAGTPEQCVEALTPFRDLGVKDFLLNIKLPIDWQTIELFSKEVIPHLQAHTTV